MKSLMVNTVYAVQIVAQCLSICAFAYLIGLGFFSLFKTLSYWNDPYLFLKYLLHSLEILFIAPIPMLIIYSFRVYVFLLFPFDDQDKERIRLALAKSIDPDVAKKAFVTSIIGVISTFILGSFIELLSMPKEGVGEGTKVLTAFRVNWIDYRFLIMLAMAIIFLVIQIVFYRWLAAHVVKPKHSDTDETT